MKSRHPRPFRSSSSSRPPLLAIPLAALVALAFCALAQPPAGDQQIVAGDDVHMVRELAAVLRQDAEGLRVALAAPVAARPEAYRQIDIATGDRVLMMNGRRVRDLAQVRETYDALASGEEVAFGLERGRQKLILRFAKADPASLPDRMLVGGDGGAHASGGMAVQVLGGEGDVTPVLGFGIVAGQEDGEVRVSMVVPGSQTPLRDGDRILRVGDRKIATAQELAEIVDALEVGDEVELELRRAGSEQSETVRLAKAESRAQVMIRGGN